MTLFDAKVTSTVALNVRQLVITPSGTSSGVYAFANDQLSVKVNGSEVATITSADFTGAVTAFTKTVSIPVDTSSAARITIVGSSIKNTVAGSQNYTFQVKLADVRDAANNSVSLLTDTVTGDKTTVQAPTLTLKAATLQPSSNNTISNSSNQEVGRFALTAEGDAVRVTKIVINNLGSAALTGVVDASSIELRDAATDAKLQGTVTLSGNMITVDSMTNDVSKDVTQNIKVIFTSVKTLDPYYTQTVILQVASSGLTTTTVNGGATVTLPVATISGKTYTINVVVPTVTVMANSNLKSGTPGPVIAKVKVTNTDSNTGITLSGITLFMKASAPGSNGSIVDRQVTGTICLKAEGETNICGLMNTTAGSSLSAVSSASVSFVLPGNITASLMDLAKNTGNYTFDVVVDGMAWNTGDKVTITAMDLTYQVGGVAVPVQSTKDQAGAVATSTAKE